MCCSIYSWCSYRNAYTQLEIDNSTFRIIIGESGFILEVMTMRLNGATIANSKMAKDLISFTAPSSERAYFAKFDHYVDHGRSQHKWLYIANTALDSNAAGCLIQNWASNVVTADCNFLNNIAINGGVMALFKRSSVAISRSTVSRFLLMVAILPL